MPDKKLPKQHGIVALFNGYLATGLTAILAFIVCRHLLLIDEVTALIITTGVFVITSLAVIIVLTHKLQQPLKHLDSELQGLQEKIEQSTSALASVHGQTTALAESIPVGLAVFDHEMKLKLYNKRLEDIFINQAEIVTVGEKQDKPEKLSSSSILEKLKSAVYQKQQPSIIDWINTSRAQKVQDYMFWPMAEIAGVDGAYDIVAYYNKSADQDFELVLAFVNRSDDQARTDKQIEFISLAAHELRGPLSVMRGLIDVFQTEVNQSLSEDHQQLLTRMSVSAKQLASYVDNILNVSRIERENFQVKLGRHNLAEVVKSAIVDLDIRARANHRSLKMNVPSDLPEVAIDPDAISHVFHNIVDNAIKYSKIDGEIHISATSKDGAVEVTIQDFGIGMPAAVVDNLFTKFYRSHRSRQTVSGTGLGLYLSKAIVEAHGGKIWVRSTEKLGSTFGFTLPLYESVKDRIKSGELAVNVTGSKSNWIKNHALVRK